MQIPTEFQLEQLLRHASANYDPVKAHEYYERTKKLKGRKSGQKIESHTLSRVVNPDPRKGKPQKQITRDARRKQRKALALAIQNLERKLQDLEKLIKKKMREEASENRKAKAEKERAAKERDKPKSAAEKAKIARENKKYREQHQQELKTEAKRERNSAGGSSTKKTAKDSKTGPSVSDLKALASRVRGQLVIAKQKLAAL